MLAVVLAGLLWLVNATPLWAHGELVRSEPSVDAVIPEGPRQVTLWFSEAPELRFSALRVLDPQGQRVDRGDLRVDPADRSSLVVGLRPGAVGTHTVIWTMLSAVDGHVTRGAFGFTVGLDQAPTPLVVEATDVAGSTATASKVVLRVGAYAGWAGLLGAFAFVLWVLLPGLALGGATYNTTVLLLRRVWNVALAAGGIALLATVGALLAQAVAVADGADLAGFASALGALAFETRFGLLWWFRLVLLLVACWVALLARTQGPSPLLLRVGLGVSIGALFSLALGSHAAAVPGGAGLAVMFDWLHLVAMTLWVGGLAHLLGVALALRGAPSGGERVRVLAPLVPRMSLLAIAAVGVLGLTGVYQSWLQVGSWEALGATAYGRALLTKLVVLGLVLALGAVNLWYWRPRLAQGRRGAAADAITRRLQWAVGAELALLLGVLLVVGVMSNLLPGREALVARGLVVQTTHDRVGVTVQVQPGVVGQNRIEVRLVEQRLGLPLGSVESVRLRPSLPGSDLKMPEIVTTPRGDGRFVASTGGLVTSGVWRFSVVGMRAGAEVGMGDLEVPLRGASSLTPGAPAAGEGPLVLGLELLVIGLVAFGYVYWVAPRDQRRVPLPLTLAVVALLGGSLLAGGGVGTLRSADLTNPVPLTSDSVAQGRLVYEVNCIHCHGPTGKGDGPASAGLQPRTSDFRTHLAAGHTDAQLFEWVTKGVPNTAMPAYAQLLTEDERWHVLNYIRYTFGGER